MTTASGATTHYFADWRNVPEKLWRWPNFSPEEIACRGDGTIRINEPALDKLQALRDRLGAPDIAVGNIIGSNIANILLIVGLTALVWPIHVAGCSMRRDTAFMIAAGLFLVPLFALGEIGRLAGTALLAGLGFYLLWTFLKPEQDSANGESEA